MKGYIRLLLIFIATLVISFLLYYTGIWALAILAGFISAVMLSNSYSSGAAVSFLSGILSSLLFLFANYSTAGGPIFVVAYDAGAIAGIPGYIFIVITLIVSGAYCATGNVIGTYFKKLLHF